MNEKHVTSVLDEYKPLVCVWCEKDLLEEGQGNVVLVRSFFASSSKWKVVAVYAACKRTCDKAARAGYRNLGCSLSSQDLQDLINPLGFMRWVVALMNQLYAKENCREAYSPMALEILKMIILRISQKAFRQPTTSERDKALEDQWWRDIGPAFDVEDLRLEDFQLLGTISLKPHHSGEVGS